MLTLKLADEDTPNHELVNGHRLAAAVFLFLSFTFTIVAIILQSAGFALAAIVSVLLTRQSLTLSRLVGSPDTAQPPTLNFVAITGAVISLAGVPLLLINPAPLTPFAILALVILWIGYVLWPWLILRSLKSSG
jgi:amino acid permease